MLRLYDFTGSGNGYKARLLLGLLNISYELVEKDIMAGETRTPEFLAMNPDGRIPLLALESGDYLAQSDAILYYLAEGTPYWPADPSGRLDRARVLQWMFFEQYNHEPTVAVARFIVHFLPADHPRQADLPVLREKGHAALQVMEDHLAAHEWMAAGRPTIADLALFAYTHVAGDGGIMLDDYVAINAWMDRIRSLPGFVAM